MANPTTNFGWVMPTSTDLVTDLPADFNVFGQGVDTSMADLLGGTTGQILAKASNTNMDFTWITNDVGDITAVNVTSPVTGGGSSGAVTIGINAATTSVVGAVQLSDSTSTTSSVLASTPTATKSAYDLAAAAVPKSTVTTAGDVIYATGSGAVTRLGIGTTGQVLTVNGAGTAPSWATPSSGSNLFYAGKNKIINGAFNNWQRGISFTNPTYAANTYTSDRWVLGYANANPTTATISQQTFTPGAAPVAGYESAFFIRSSVTTIGSTTIFRPITQRIEDVRTFANQTATLSFWAKGDSARSLTVNYQQVFGSGGSGDVGGAGSVVTLSTSWQRFSVSFSIPSISGKTIGTNSYLEILFQQAAANGSVLDIWGVQLEAGSTATDFQTATGSITGELALCQRYYFRENYDGASNYAIFTTGSAFSTTVTNQQQPFLVQMRVKPTVIDYPTPLATFFSVGDIDHIAAPTSITLAASQNTNYQGYISINVASGLTQYRTCFLRGFNNTGAYLGWSAEL